MMKITTKIQTSDFHDESQLSFRPIQLKMSNAESEKSGLVGPSESSKPALQRSVML